MVFSKLIYSVRILIEAIFIFSSGELRETIPLRWPFVFSWLDFCLLHFSKLNHGMGILIEAIFLFSSSELR